MRKVAVLGMLTALAYLSVVIFRIPVNGFLDYEPKDVIITIGGFLYGPACAGMMAIVVSLVEMVTISATGLIGCVMNILATLAFSFVAALIYHRRRTLAGALVGLVCGVLTMTATMLLWNAAVTPIYMGVPRDLVMAMLLPVFLPFNLVKAGLNAGFVLLLYKPTSRALKAAGLMPKAAQPTPILSRRSLILSCTAVLLIGVFLFLIFWMSAGAN